MSDAKAVFVLIDDCLAEKSAAQSAVENVFKNGRHYGSMLVMSEQAETSAAEYIHRTASRRDATPQAPSSSST